MKLGSKTGQGKDVIKSGATAYVICIKHWFVKCCFCRSYWKWRLWYPL